MRLARFGDNMRNVAVTEGDKVEAELRFGVSVNTYGVNDLVAVVDAVADADDRRAGRRVRRHLRRRARAAARRRPARVAALRRPHRARPAAVPRPTAASRAFTTNFEDLGGLRQLPGLAVQRLMADGYGFGGEGDWKTSVLLRTLKVVAEGLPGGTSFMEDYTYHLGPRRGEDPRRAHARGLPLHRGGAGRRVEIHPLGIGGREDPVRLVFDAAPGAAVVLGIADLGDRFRFVANAVDGRPPGRAAARTCPVARAVWRPEPDLRTSTEAWLTAGGPHHTVLSTALTTEHLDDLAEMTGHRAGRSSTPTPPSAPSSGSCGGTRPTTGWRRAL